MNREHPAGLTALRHNDRAGVWLRAGYWWVSAGTASFGPYLALYYRQRGFSGIQIGLLLAMVPLGAAFMAPTWGLMADAFGAHRLVLRCVLTTAASAALLLTQATGFGPVLLLMAVLALSTAPVASLFDSYGVTLSEQLGIPYGRLRIWGSLGYIAAASVVGRWMGGAVSRFFFVAYAACLLLALTSSLGLPVLKLRSAQPAWHGVRRVLRDRSVLLLLLTIYLVWSSTSIMYSFIGIYIHELGGGAQLIGAAYSLSAISELPVLAFSAWFFTHLGSRRMIGMAISLYTLRFFIYSLLPSAVWVLPVQLMHGLTYGALLMASVTLAHQLAGRELAATAQGLLSSMSVGFGTITGSLLGGALLDRIGVIALFRVASAIMLVALVIYLAGLRLFADMRPADRTAPQPAEEKVDSPACLNDSSQSSQNARGI